MKPVNIKELQNKARHLRVRVFDPARPGEPFTAVVESSSNSAFNQIVTIRFVSTGEIKARCTCAWAQHGGVACTHVLAALNALAGRKHRLLSFWLTPEDARRQKQRVLRLIGDGTGDIWITSRSPITEMAVSAVGGSGRHPLVALPSAVPVKAVSAVSASQARPSLRRLAFR